MLLDPSQLCSGSTSWRSHLAPWIPVRLHQLLLQSCFQDTLNFEDTGEQAELNFPRSAFMQLPGGPVYVLSSKIKLATESYLDFVMDPTNTDAVKHAMKSRSAKLSH